MESELRRLLDNGYCVEFSPNRDTGMYCCTVRGRMGSFDGLGEDPSELVSRVGDRVFDVGEEAERMREFGARLDAVMDAHSSEKTRDIVVGHARGLKLHELVERAVEELFGSLDEHRIELHQFASRASKCQFRIIEKSAAEDGKIKIYAGEFGVDSSDQEIEDRVLLACNTPITIWLSSFRDSH